MEVDSEADSRRTLGLRKKRSRSSCEKSTSSWTWMRVSRKVTRKSGSKALLQIEHWRNDLLPDHEKMQKMSPKLQCLQDNMLQCKKKSRASGPKELKRSRPRSSSCKRNWRTMRRRSWQNHVQEAKLEKEIEHFEAGGGRRRSDGSQSNLCCVGAVILEQLVSLGKEHAYSSCEPSMGKSVKYFRIDGGRCEEPRCRNASRGKVGGGNRQIASRRRRRQTWQ